MMLPASHFALDGIEQHWPALAQATAHWAELDAAAQRQGLGAGSRSRDWERLACEARDGIATQSARDWYNRLAAALPAPALPRCLALLILHRQRWLQRLFPGSAPGEAEILACVTREQALFQVASRLAEQVMYDAALASSGKENESAIGGAPQTAPDAPLPCEEADALMLSQFALALLGDTQTPPAYPTHPPQDWEDLASRQPAGLRALAGQLAAGALHLDADGMFQPVPGQGLALPVQLPGEGETGPVGELPPLSWLYALHVRGLLALALREGWIGAHAAIRLSRQSDYCAPFQLLCHTQAELAGMRHGPALLDTVAYLRERHTALAEQLDQVPAQTEHGKFVARPVSPSGSDRWGYSPTLAMVGSAPLLRACAWLAGNTWDGVPFWRKFAHQDFLDLRCLDTQEQRADVVAALRHCGPLALERALQHCSAAADSLIFEALGHAALLPLLAWTHGYLREHSADSEPPLGVIEPAAVLPILQALPTPAWHWFRDVYLAHGSELHARDETARLLGALLGENAAALVKSALTKHAHVPIKALGLLPLPAGAEGEAACIERYVQLQQVGQEATRYGALRQANQRAAAIIGLRNLAVSAGYAELGELEWAMEARQGAALQAWFTPQAMGGYSAYIDMAAEPAGPVVINARGKRLANAPAALKKVPEWLALKAAWDALKAQRRRFVRALEHRLVAQTPMSPAQAGEALRHPLMADLVARLVWQDESGRQGLLSAQGLEGPDDAQPPHGALRLVHPHGWLAAGVLAQWQAWAVARGLVQPVKQVFRELYVPTPAEREAGYASGRYAGRRARTVPAQGIFKTRNWRPSDGGGCAEHHRRFADGTVARFDFDFDPHFFTELPELTTGAVTFDRDGSAIALAEVPPIVFSETMRDLDLLIARAIAEGGEHYSSAESLAGRRALLQALAPALGADRIEVDERHVHVRGKLAQYRIHLASAHIHLEPGAYLCVIPDARAAAGKPLRLPFEEDDARTAEIVSKVLLLLDDDQITDPAITGQIRQGAGQD
ncbi:DUF4132 domain-containing protein [Cupriavidus basilensis]|uniref:DUF4132 domain-containing protein n=1 Tax=Cupriavidus basilensis TaxID=68895 RepID=A0ABT6AU81_9BURK|nr:DUF4132 domain-containing protein [Cupriavidus basilensis]MDF3836148.1 DUF4132 domain-containing protein [Cupriavidus basilensis]